MVVCPECLAQGLRVAAPVTSSADRLKRQPSLLAPHFFRVDCPRSGGKLYPASTTVELSDEAPAGPPPSGPTPLGKCIGHRVKCPNCGRASGPVTQTNHAYAMFTCSFCGSLQRPLHFIVEPVPEPAEPTMSPEERQREIKRLEAYIAQLEAEQRGTTP
jgi:hypothetical protein